MTNGTKQLVALLLCAWSTVTYAQPSRPNVYMGREIAPFMSADGAAWLTREAREREEQPQLLLKTLQLKPGQRVCDFGCGNGYYALELAQRVGPTGEVWAVDIQPEMLDLLGKRIEARQLKNIRPTLATETDPRLPAGTLDLVLMVDVYHELSHPEEVLDAVRRSLRPTGRLVLVEFRAEDPNVPIKPLHKMSQPQVLKELTSNRFKLVDQFDQLPWQHVMCFADDRSPLPAIGLVPWAPRGTVGEKLPESRTSRSGKSLPAHTAEGP
jgi:SAM-dependent methyltransferase